MGRALRISGVALAAVVWGCFNPPSADVLFSCDPVDAPACPPDYSCQSDGCCHRDGSDIEASLGACNQSATSGADESGSETTSTSGTGASSSSTTALDGSSDSTAAEAESTSDTSSGSAE